MSHKGWGFLFTCQTCLSLSNILWIQKLYIKFSTTLSANLLREMKPWSKDDVVASEVLIGLEQYRNKGTFSLLLDPLLQGISLWSPGWCNAGHLTTFQRGLSSSTRPWESYSSVRFFPCVPNAPRTRQHDIRGRPRYSEASRCCKTWCMPVASHWPTSLPVNTSCSSAKKCLSEVTFELIPNCESGPCMAEKGKRKTSSFADLFGADVEVQGSVIHYHRRASEQMGLWT